MIKKAIENSPNMYVTGLLDLNGKSTKYSIDKNFWSYVKIPRKDNPGSIPLKNEDDTLVYPVVKVSAFSTNTFSPHLLIKTEVTCQFLPTATYTNLPYIQKSVENLSRNTNIKKANGWILKEVATETVRFLQFIFMQCIKKGETKRPESNKYRNNAQGR